MKSIMILTRLAVAGILASSVRAHSWVEQLMNVASNGTMVGEPGYPRGNVHRGTPGFSDPAMVNIIPANGRPINQIYASDLMCKDTQNSQNQTDGSPRLQTTPGASVSLRYQENGHVTLPQNQPGKPPNRGTLYVYGTTQPRDDDKFLSIHRVWTADGKGGDGRGVLLSTQNFDDGQCYQINSGSISELRQKDFSHIANTLMGADLWCQQDIQIPTTAPTGQPYTMYWVWDWPTMPGTSGFPDGKQELYTTCMDVDVVDNGGMQSKSIGGNNFIVGQNFADAGIQSQLADISNPTAVVGEFIPFSTASGSPTAEPSTGIPSFLTEHPSATAQPTDGHGHGHGHGHGGGFSIPFVSFGTDGPAPTAAATPAITDQPQPTDAPAPGVKTVTEYESVFETVFETVYQTGLGKRAEVLRTAAPDATNAVVSLVSPHACSKTHQAYRVKGRNPFVIVPPSGEPTDAC